MLLPDLQAITSPSVFAAAGVKGRGDYVRLCFEEAGVAYEDAGVTYGEHH
jgi:hypothetical protein